MKKPSIRNILVPIDFSKISIQALQTAKSLARHLDATIHLVHVRQFTYSDAFLSSAFTSERLPGSYDAQRARQLANQLKTVRIKSGLSTRARTHVITGGPAFHEICRLAQKIPADLIVTATHGRTGLKHVLLGSTAERIVQHSPCPVFVVRQKRTSLKTRRMFTTETIVVPVDFSACSLEGLNYAIPLADRVAAKIVLLHAVPLGPDYTSGSYAMYDLSGLEQKARTDGEERMRNFVSRLKFRPVKFETAITIGTPVQEICSFAELKDADLVITSTHGWTGLKRVLIGSTAERLVRHAPCSVLVVPCHSKVRTANLIRPAERGHKKPARLRKTSRRARSSQSDRTRTR
jgi:nucleotide-binding universal stress UspA family protein